MPIATLVENTIVPRMAFTFSGKVARAQNSGRSLPFRHVQATQPSSLWATAAVAAAEYYRNDSAEPLAITEEDLAVQVRRLNHRARAVAANDPYALALRAVGHLRRGPLAGPALRSLVEGEIDEGRPVGARIEWSSGLAHFITIFGYREQNGTCEYVVDDPIYGIFAVPDWSLAHSYLCDGTWTHHYLTR